MPVPLIARACDVASGSMTDSVSFSSREVHTQYVAEGHIRRGHGLRPSPTGKRARDDSSFILIRLSARRDVVKLIPVYSAAAAAGSTLNETDSHTDRLLLRAVCVLKTLSFETRNSDHH